MDDGRKQSSNDDAGYRWSPQHWTAFGFRRSVDYCGLVYTQVYQYSRTLTDRAHTLNRLFSKVGV
jgi:hypothetical protein